MANTVNDDAAEGVGSFDYFCPKCHSRNIFCFFNREWHCLDCGARWVYYEIKD